LPTDIATGILIRLSILVTGFRDLESLYKHGQGKKKYKKKLGSWEKVEIIPVWGSGTSFVNILSY
jgi:hypothetical protein